MTTENARRVKLAGHAAEKEFAELINGKVSTGSRKKDVIDSNGYVYSIKSGDKKWQIFLYGRSRLLNEIDFQGAKLIKQCLDCFPDSRENYTKNKPFYKNLLKKEMITLKQYLNKNNNKLIFFKKSFLNNGEVDFFVIKDNGVFHVFNGEEFIKLIDTNTYLENSKAVRKDQFDFQKVIFKIEKYKTTLGEIEVRNDSKVHYREAKFWLDKKKTLQLLKSEITKSKNLIPNKITAFGKAINKFKIL